MSRNELRERIKDRYDISDLLDFLDIDIDEFLDYYYEDLMNNPDFLEEIGFNAGDVA